MGKKSTIRDMEAILERWRRGKVRGAQVSADLPRVLPATQAQPPSMGKKPTIRDVEAILERWRREKVRGTQVSADLPRVLPATQAQPPSVGKKPTIRDVEAILERHRCGKVRGAQISADLPRALPATQARPPSVVDTTDTPEGRAELKGLLDEYPEAAQFVSEALGRGAWVGICIGAMMQWDYDPDWAREIMEDWVANWKGYPQEYEARLSELRDLNQRPRRRRRR